MDLMNSIGGEPNPAYACWVSNKITDAPVIVDFVHCHHIAMDHRALDDKRLKSKTRGVSKRTMRVFTWRDF